MKQLHFPFDEKSIRALKAGDAVSITGRIYTGRDKFHKHFADGKPVLVDFRDGALYHCGPVVLADDVTGGWKVLAAGPTTSVRENPYEPAFIAKSGVRLIIGKGGMDRATLEAMRRHGCVYVQAVGGAAALSAASVCHVAGVSYLKEFGAAEAVWHFDVEDFRGVVAMDAHGRSLFDDVKARSEKARDALVKVGRAACAALALLAAGMTQAVANDIAKYDSRMAVAEPVVANGVKWLDGRSLPCEGRAFEDVELWYDRLPAHVTTNVNGGVRAMKHHSTGLQFRFSTDSKKLHFRWVPLNGGLSMDHMPATGMSGIDVYRRKSGGQWRYAKTGRIYDAKKGGTLVLDWTPGDECLVNLPLYNGIRSFALGIDAKASVKPLPPRTNGVTKPVVFYGTSITHGGCCSRPGLAFASIVGRDLDVPVVNLGFSGSGVMEYEMGEHLARIDASCYVLDCLWNMNLKQVSERYEPLVRNLRAKRPNVPIVFAEQCDVFCGPPNDKDRFVRRLYDRLVAEGWKNLVYLPKTHMYTGDWEGTVDGCHPNDWGMMSMSKAFGAAVREALKLK